MQVTKERFEDVRERDADGFYDYHYTGHIYRFAFATHVLVARRYDDTIAEASFIGVTSVLGV